jgi:hypothetical protein
MICRLIASISLLALVVTSARNLTAQAPAQPCKTTVTGTLEVVLLESKVYGG